MAKIIENEFGRRIIKMSTDDIISIVREYQTIIKNITDYQTVRIILKSNPLYIPEDM